jgi:DNA-binding transcriptional LysR family regulator
MVILPKLARFNRTYPEIILEITSSNDPVDLVAGESSDGNLRGCQGRRRRAAFILTLDSPASYFTIELGTKRNAVQLSFVP